MLAGSNISGETLLGVEGNHNISWASEGNAAGVISISIGSTLKVNHNTYKQIKKSFPIACKKYSVASARD